MDGQSSCRSTIEWAQWSVTVDHFDLRGPGRQHTPVLSVSLDVEPDSTTVQQVIFTLIDPPVSEKQAVRETYCEPV